MTAAGEKLTKSFAGVRVLDGVDITLRQGEVHALLGANGSGKSTLVKILTGVYQPEAGTIRVGDRAFRSIDSPHDATALGIAVVHQESPLIDTMTVAECVAMFRGYPTSGMGRIRWQALFEETQELFDRFNLPVSPRQLAGTLDPAQRALVGLVIALDRVKEGVSLLILDEATASIPEDQAKAFLDRVARIAADGTGVLMVTHRLAELHGLATTVTVLRDGRVVYAAPAGQASDNELVTHMVGTARTASARTSASASGTVRRLWNSAAGNRAVAQAMRSGDKQAIVIDNLSGTILRGISLNVSAGEIVGVAGLADSGIAELPQILGGMLARRGGDIRISGSSLAANAGPAEVIAAGVALLPADRLHNGGIGTLSVADNILLPLVDRFWHRQALEDTVLDRVIDDFDIRPPTPQATFGKLSGGNQQKALLGKWLLTQPRALVLDDPTSGVDPGAREKIFDILRDAASEGIGVLFFSTEPEQLAAMCSRVLVLKAGRVARELSGSELTRESISRWCYA